MTQISQRTNNPNADAAKDAWLATPRKLTSDFSPKASGEESTIAIHPFKAKDVGNLTLAMLRQ